MQVKAVVLAVSVVFASANTTHQAADASKRPEYLQSHIDSLDRFERKHKELLKELRVTYGREYLMNRTERLIRLLEDSIIHITRDAEALIKSLERNPLNGGKRKADVDEEERKLDHMNLLPLAIELLTLQVEALESKMRERAFRTLRLLANNHQQDSRFKWSRHRDHCHCHNMETESHEYIRTQAKHVSSIGDIKEWRRITSFYIQVTSMFLMLAHSIVIVLWIGRRYEVQVNDPRRHRL